MRCSTLATCLALPLWLGACDLIFPRHDTVRADSTAVPAPPAQPAHFTPAKPVAAAPVDEHAPWDPIRGSLRRLVLAEETHFAESGTYTGDLKTLGIHEASPRMTLTLLWADRNGWAARGAYRDVPGKDCVVYVGRMRAAPATRQYRRQAGEGVPVCDEPPPARVAPVARSRGAAPAGSRPAAVADTTSALDAVNPVVQMKVDLRNLARAQELWFATQGAYARRTEPLAMQYAWHRGVTVRILHADRNSWSAEAIHARLPGKSCVIWAGKGTGTGTAVTDSASTPPGAAPQTDGQHDQPAHDGVPVCDDPE